MMPMSPEWTGPSGLKRLCFGLAACCLSALAGCSSKYDPNREPIRDFDPPEIVALKHAGAAVMVLPIASSKSASYRVNLTGIKLTREITEQLLAARGVQELTMTGADVTDDLLKQIVEQHQLIQLDVSGSGISDAGLASLTSLSSLQTVNLNNTKITGEGVASLPPKIATLQVANTQITNDDVPRFAKLTNLNFVNLAGTKFTAEGVNKLKASRPDLIVMGIKLR